jgi:hypothetical protein
MRESLMYGSVRGPTWPAATWPLSPRPAAILLRLRPKLRPRRSRSFSARNGSHPSSIIADIAAKRLGLLHDLVPKAVRIAVLVNPANPKSAEATLRDIPEAARAIGLQIQVLNASTSREMEAAFITLVRDRVDALFVALARPGGCPRHPGAKPVAFFCRWNALAIAKGATDGAVSYPAHCISCFHPANRYTWASAGYRASPVCRPCGQMTPAMSVV